MSLATNHSITVVIDGYLPSLRIKNGHSTTGESGDETVGKSRLTNYDPINHSAY